MLVRHLRLLPAFLATTLVGLLAMSVGAEGEAAARSHGAALGASSDSYTGIGARLSPVLGIEKVFYASSELRLEAKNTSGTPFRGTMRLLSDPWNTAPHVVLEVPFSVEAHATARLQVPIHARENGLTMRLELVDSAGSVRSTDDLRVSGASHQLVLVDVHERSPFAASFSLGRDHEFRASASLVRADRDNASAASASDGWVLPNTLAGYSGASVVLLDSSTLVDLSPSHLETLAQWVEHGGTVAFIVSRPGDLQHAKMKRLVGENVTAAPVTAATVNRVRALDDSFRSTDPVQRPRMPTPFSIDHVRSDFAGGGSRPSPFGAFVPRGLGSVVLLAFDPNEPDVADQPFTRQKVYDLLVEAQDRSRAVLSSPSTAESPLYATHALRKALDPNEHFRFGLAFAAGLLCIYAILVGPVLFMRAKKRGSALAPYLVAPVLSGATFMAIIATGSISRGLSGGVRRITLSEQASGDDRGSEVVYRGFYPPSSSNMRVAAAKPGALLDLGLSDADAIGDETLEWNGLGKGAVDPGAPMAFNDVRTRPWRTFIAREFSRYETKGSVTLEYTGSDVKVINRTAETIHNAFVSIPHNGVYYLGRDVEPGATLSAHAGTFLFGTVQGRVTALREYDLENALPAAKRASFRRAWGAIDELKTSSNAWPAERPVLIGELDRPLSGETPKTTDSGLTVRSATFLLRVVGQEHGNMAPLSTSTQPGKPGSNGGAE